MITDVRFYQTLQLDVTRVRSGAARYLDKTIPEAFA